MSGEIRQPLFFTSLYSSETAGRTLICHPVYFNGRLRRTKRRLLIVCLTALRKIGTAKFLPQPEEVKKRTACIGKPFRNDLKILVVMAVRTVRVAVAQLVLRGRANVDDLTLEVQIRSRQRVIEVHTDHFRRNIEDTSAQVVSFTVCHWKQRSDVNIIFIDPAFFVVEDGDRDHRDLVFAARAVGIGRRDREIEDRAGFEPVNFLLESRDDAFYPVQKLHRMVRGRFFDLFSCLVVGQLVFQGNNHVCVNFHACILEAKGSQESGPAII